MKITKTLSALGFSAAIVFSIDTAAAREGAPPMSRIVPVRALPTVAQLVVEATDAQAELAKDGPRPALPIRFAAATEVTVTPLTHGTWEDVVGGRLWRLRVESEGSTDLNFGFTTYWLPQGATLHVYAEDEDYIQGPYDSRDNQEHAELWTPVLPGGRVVIELFVPNRATERPQLVLSRVNRGYRDMFGRQQHVHAKSGACNINVVCALGDAWRQEIRSVARYTVSGTGLCTGTLLNTANSSVTNQYFLTAHHCGVSSGAAASVVVYWNFQSATCGVQGGGSLVQNQSGTFFRATRQDVDMTLLELDEIPNPTFRVYYAGWDRSGTAPSGAIGIHHPNGDEKAITSSSNALTTVNNCIGTGGGSANTHWSVTWTLGTTEPGSSGSALFNPSNHRVIGFLSGGGASCTSPFSPDCYGKFSIAWDGASASSRLRDWLDPQGSNVSGVSGRDPSGESFIVAAGSALVAENCYPGNNAPDPSERVTIVFSLQNQGSTNTGNLVATLLATNGVAAPSAPQTFGVLSNNGSVVTRQFSFTVTGLCSTVISPTLQLQDGASNRGNVSFTMRIGVPNTVVQSFDGVTQPALPAGWTTTFSGSTTGWRTTTTRSQTAPNSAFTPNTSVESAAALVSPLIPITTPNASVTFAHWYTTEPVYDGGVLEISVNGAAYIDILASGASFGGSGYNGFLDSSFGNPLGDRAAWTADSGGFVTTIVNLPASMAGKTIRLRWVLGSDSSESALGWNVDTVTIADGFACCDVPPPPQIIETRKVNNNIVFSFNTVTAHTYYTEFQNILDTNLLWTALQTNAGDGGKKSVTNSTGTTTNRVFRVRVQ